MMSVSHKHARNVKRWRDGKMALRCAASMVEAGKQFRRVNVHLHPPALRRTRPRVRRSRARRGQ
jgi:putative transposase